MNKDQLYEREMLANGIQFAKEAGKLVLAGMNKPLQIDEKKNRSDLVTDVDVQSEGLLRSQIGLRYPDHWILSEETDGGGDAYGMMLHPPIGYGWIIDPIDGTTNFIQGIPHFAISIGILRDGEPLFGIVYNPVTEDLYQAEKDEGAFHNGVRIQVGQVNQLANALLATGFQAADWKRESIVAAQIERVAGTSRDVRIFGCASLDLCWVASGLLSGFWHDGLYPWDVAAGWLIVREAGGSVTNRDGQPFTLGDESLVASNKRIHSSLLPLLFTLN